MARTLTEPKPSPEELAAAKRRDDAVVAKALMLRDAKIAAHISIPRVEPNTTTTHTPDLTGLAARLRALAEINDADVLRAEIEAIACVLEGDKVGVEAAA